MLIPGLVSVSFRQLDVPAVLDLARRAGLQAIEWGGDVHVPHGDLSRAREVRARMADAGLQTVAYGSYYRVGESEAQGLAFGRVLDTALALGAPSVRVWAGAKGSRVADASYRRTVVVGTRRIAAAAAAAGIKVAFEHHESTLADSDQATLSLLREAGGGSLFTYWQPLHDLEVAGRTQSLRALLPRLGHVHVFEWSPRGVRRPLEDGQKAWRQYLGILKASRRDHAVLLEFVRDDSAESLLRDATTLLGWLSE